MAQGDLTLFDQFLYDLGQKKHDLKNDVFVIALLKSAPKTSQVDPVWANLASEEVEDVASQELVTSWSEELGISTFTAVGKPAVLWKKDENGPPDIKYGVIRNESAPDKNLVAHIDFTSSGGQSAISLADGDIEWTPNSGGIFRLGIPRG
jgi:hypothetical protein